MLEGSPSLPILNSSPLASDQPTQIASHYRNCYDHQAYEKMGERTEGKMRKCGG